MKTINRMVLLLATLFAAIGCSDDDKELVMYSLRFEPNSITLGIGKSYRLVPISDPFYDDVQYEWKSVDERVATVDQSGVVTGVSAGSTEVRAFYGDNRLARCLVSVVESTSSLPDPTAALSEGLSQQMIFSSNQLPYKGTIMQCFDFYDENGYIYYTQSVGDTKTGNRWMVALGRQKRNEAPSDDYMKLQWFGHGTLLVAERADDGDYVWVNSNGTLSGTDYTNNLTFSRIRYQKGAVLSHYAGDTFYMSEYVDAAGTTWTVRDVQPSIDFVNRRLLIGCRTTDMRHNVIYDLDAVLALGKETVEITRTWGGETAAEGVTEKDRDDLGRGTQSQPPDAARIVPSAQLSQYGPDAPGLFVQPPGTGRVGRLRLLVRRTGDPADGRVVRRFGGLCGRVRLYRQTGLPPHAGGRLLRLPEPEHVARCEELLLRRRGDAAQTGAEALSGHCDPYVSCVGQPTGVDPAIRMRRRIAVGCDILLFLAWP